MTDKKDYYDVLGVERNASEDDLKKAYRNIALKHPPGARRRRRLIRAVGQRRKRVSGSARAYVLSRFTIRFVHARHLAQGLAVVLGGALRQSTRACPLVQGDAILRFQKLRRVARRLSVRR